MLPRGPEGASATRRLAALAEECGLARVRAEAAAPVESGPEPYVPASVTAEGRYADAECFLARLREGSTRLTSLARLEVARAAAGAVRLTARARLHYSLSSVAREREATIRAVRERWEDPLGVVVVMARDLPPSYGLDELVAEDGGVRLRGFKMLPGPALLMEPALRWVGLEATSFSVQRREACDRFELAGRPPKAFRPAGTEVYGVPAPAELFAADEARCELEAAPIAPIVIRGPAPSAPAGPLTLRLRDVDLADVFWTLHALAGEDFVVDGAVMQRVSVDLADVSLEEALAALEGAGIQVSPLGRLRRVSLAGQILAPAALLPGQGTPISFAWKHTDIAELLRLFHDLTGRAIVSPSGNLGRVSLFAKETPWEELMSVALHPAGLRVRLEGEERIVVERASGIPEPAPAVRPVHPLEKRIPREPGERGIVADYGPPSVYDLELVGVVRVGGDWYALGASPHGTTYRSKAGYRLMDATLEAVDAEGVTLRTDGGLVLRMSLPPLH